MTISAETVSDAARLLDFITRKGIRIDGSEVRAIVEIENGAKNGDAVQTETVVKFWEAFATLCSSARPTTLSMVKSGLAKPEKPRWVEFRGWFPAFGVLLFMLVAGAQVYAGIGGRLVSILEDERAIHEQKAADTLRSQQTLQTLQTALHAAKEDQRPKVEEQLQQAFQDWQMLFGQVHDSQTRLDLYLERLDRWNRAWEITTGSIRAAFGSILYALRPIEARAGVAKAKSASVPVSTDDPAKAATSKEAGQKLQDGQNAYSSDDLVMKEASDKVIATARVHAETLFDASTVIDAFQSLILPFLYGSLGACVLLLKRHSEEIADGIVSPRFTYRVRLALGCMAGVAIGWVSTLVVTEDAQTLAPQTMAFLAGYNVEMLAAALDKISFR